MQRFYVASRKGVFTFENWGGGWKPAAAAFVGDNYSLVGVDPRDGSVYAAADLGHFGAKVQRSTDHGRTWTEVGTPAYPEAPPGEPAVDQWGKPVPWKLVKIWAFAFGPASRPGEIWCGTIPGGLFRSSDHGHTWELNRPLWDEPRRKNWFGGGADLPGLHSICVHPTNADDVTTAVSCGGVWATTDRGASWEVRGAGMYAAFMPPERQHDLDIQDAHIMVQCESAPDRLWVQHHNGIFKSSDRGRTFVEVKEMGPSTFGFAVAVHPKNPDVAWFVPGVKDECRVPASARLVVTRTTDGGQTATVLSKGLPGESAYDVVYRHALDVDATGDRLAFGSTTGNLWISEDQGDSWTALSTFLPPIHCVRFDPT